MGGGEAGVFSGRVLKAAVTVNERLGTSIRKKGLLQGGGTSCRSECSITSILVNPTAENTGRGDLEGLTTLALIISNPPTNHFHGCPKLPS